MDIQAERMNEQQSTAPWASVPSSPRIGKVSRPPRSPSTVTISPYSAPSSSKKRPNNDVSFADAFSIPDSVWPTDEVKRPGHRRSASDSVTFLESSFHGPLHSSEEEQMSFFQETEPPDSNGFREICELDPDNVMAMFLDMDAIHSSLGTRVDSQSFSIKPAAKHRRGASEGGVSSWLTNAEFGYGNGGLASVKETSVQAGSVQVTTVPSGAKRRGHQRTFSEPPASLSEETSFASEEDIKPCISGSFLDRNGSTDDNHLVGLSALKKELGIAGPLKESELELLQMDPRKAKRVLANRQSAQKSRIRKLHYISDLEKRVSLLEGELKTLQPRVAFLDRQRSTLSGKNSELKQRIAALKQETGFKDALNDALQKEVERLRQNITSSTPINGRSGFEVRSSELPSNHSPLCSESNGPADPLDAPASSNLEDGDYGHVGMDGAHSKDTFQRFLDEFNTGQTNFLVDSL